MWGDWNPCGGHAEWYSDYRNTSKIRTAPQKLKVELPHDLAMPLLNTHPKESRAGSQRGICTMLTAALFTIAKTWKRHECLSEDGWMNKP